MTGCEAVHSGQSKHGEWTLYEVQADDEDGNPVVAKLRSFAPLMAGLKEYEAEPRDHEKFGRSWTLKDPAAKPGASDLRQRRRGAGGGGRGVAATGVQGVGMNNKCSSCLRDDVEVCWSVQLQASLCRSCFSETRRDKFKVSEKRAARLRRSYVARGS